MDFAALQHSVFLQALGSAILHSLWQCFILWLIYETISVSYKSASARFKNNLGTLLLFCSFAWFLTTFVSKLVTQQNVVTAGTAIPGSFAVRFQTGIHAVSGFRAFLSAASASLPYLSVAYIFLLLFLMSRLFAAYRYVYFISSKRLIHPTGELQFFASKVAREIGITKKISVWISSHIDVPATVGFIKPVILIPLASINNLSSLQLEAIILHELAHIKRNDYFTNLMICVVETILFFNPFVVLLSNIIKRERENCCDDFVLQYRYDPHSYASALLRLEQSRIGTLKLAIGAVSGKKQLLSRIKRITNSPVVSRQFNYGQKLVALVLVTAFICSVAWLSPEEKKSVANNAPGKQTKPAPPLNAKPAIKAQQPAAVIVSGKQIENLPVISMNHVSPKNELLSHPEPDTENSPENNSADDNEDNQQNDNTDFVNVENNMGYPEALNLKSPQFFADINKLKLPPFINIQNFPFQNMRLNIDFSKIDIGKWNKDMRQAYKQLKSFDWNKVQNDIRVNFSKMKDDLSKKEQDKFYGEQIKMLFSKINSLQDQQQKNSDAVNEEVQKEGLLRDSINRGNATLWNDNNIKVQRIYKKMQRQYERNTSDNYSFNYSNIAINSNADEEVNAAATCAGKNSARPNLGKKNVQISIKRISNHTGILNDKKPLHLFFYNGDEKSNREDLISVEIKD